MRISVVRLLVMCCCLCCLPVAVLAKPLGKVVATVNGVQLTDADLDQEVQKLLPSYRGVHGAVAKEKMEKVRDDAMKTLVEMELYYQDAVAKGMKLSDAELKSEIAALSRRYKSEKDFTASVANAGFTPEAFARFVERNILSQRILAREVTDKAIVTDQQAKTYYEQNVSRFNKPQEYRASHILVKVEPTSIEEERVAARKKAEGILKRIKDGGDFAVVAGEESDDLTRIKGGDIGYFHEGQALPEFDEVLPKMAVGEVSKVLETIYGFHIIKLTDKRAPRQMPFGEIKDRIKSELVEVEKKRLLEAWSSGLKAKAKVNYPASR